MKRVLPNWIKAQKQNRQSLESLIDIIKQDRNGKSK